MAKPQKIKNSDGSTSWRIRYVNADDKRVSATFATFDLARSELRRLEVGTDETRALRSRDPAAALTVAQAFARFKATQKRVSGETERRFANRWRRLDTHYKVHIEPHLADVLLADLTPRRLSQWIGVLSETKTARKGEKNEAGHTLTAATIRAVVTSLSQTVKANDVPFQVLLPQSMKQKAKRSRPKALQSIEDVRALLRAAGRDPWFKVAAAISCFAGARLGEVASLRWRHIGKGTIAITTSWEGPLKHRYEDEDEADAARTVPLDPELAEILTAWREVTGGKDDDHVVLVDGVRPLRETFDDMAQKTRSACKRAKVTSLTFHQLRASYATIAADMGLPVTRLSALMGHADVATTAIYIRPESSHAVTDPRARISGRPMDDGSSAASAMLN